MMRRLMSGALLLLVLTVAGCGGAPQPAQDRGQNTVASPGQTKTSNAQTQSIPAPAWMDSSSITTGPAANMVAKLQAKGWKAQVTGERIQPLFGAKSGEVVRADGLTVQVYAFEDAAAADKAFKIASDAQAITVDWVATPHFVKTENLLITVVTDDEAAATKITAALQP